MDKIIEYQRYTTLKKSAEKGNLESIYEVEEYFTNNKYPVEYTEFTDDEDKYKEFIDILSIAIYNCDIYAWSRIVSIFKKYDNYTYVDWRTLAVCSYKRLLSTKIEKFPVDMMVDVLMHDLHFRKDKLKKELLLWKKKFPNLDCSKYNYYLETCELLNGRDFKELEKEGKLIWLVMDLMFILSIWIHVGGYFTTFVGVIAFIIGMVLFGNILFDYYIECEELFFWSTLSLISFCILINLCGVINSLL